MYAIVDCNAFYVSCERVFNPKLEGKPVVVLSNNDGNIIARSDESKKIGIGMGAAVHEVEKILKQHKVFIFSSNYPLYGDMSNRVIAALESVVQQVEVYSIDEAFLDLSGYTRLYSSLEIIALKLKNTVRQWTGIPVSVGVAPTKTLAKVANKIAKRGSGIHVLEKEKDKTEALKNTEIGDLWGIGRKYAQKLKKMGIKTAYELIHLPENWFRKEMTVVGQRLCLELRGYSCLPLELVTKRKKNISCTRSFRTPISKLDLLKEAIAMFVSRAAEKLRKQNSSANVIIVFIRTNIFKKDVEQYGKSRSVALQVPTDNTFELIKYALRALEFIYKEGYEFKKAGIMLSGIVPSEQRQTGLYDQADRSKYSKVMAVMDEINQKLGKLTVHSAAMGDGSAGATVQKKLSKKYTTQWKDFIVVNAGENANGNKRAVRITSSPQKTNHKKLKINQSFDPNVFAMPKGDFFKVEAN